MPLPTYDLAQLQADLTSLYNEEFHEQTILGYHADNCEPESVLTVLTTNLHLLDQAYHLDFLHQQLRWVITSAKYRPGWPNVKHRVFTTKPKFTQPHWELWAKYLQLFQLQLATKYSGYTMRIPEMLDLLFCLDFDSYQDETGLVQAIIIPIYQFLVRQESNTIYGGAASITKIKLLAKLYNLELPTV